MSSLINQYLEYQDKTEPCKVYYRWSLLVATGAMLERDFWLPFGHGHVFPNMYAIMMGLAADRKSTAIKNSAGFLRSLGYNKFAPARSTREGFLLELEGRPEGYEGKDDIIMGDTPYNANEPRSMLISADELIEFIGIKNINFINTLGSLWDWDDSEPYVDRVKNGRSVSIMQPTISILGGMTPDHFATAFPPEILSQGFFSRILLVHGWRTEKRFVVPAAPDQKLGDKLRDALTQVKRKALGCASISPEAWHALEDIYNNEKDYAIQDSRFDRYSGRRFTHLLKLCLLHAALDCTREIAYEHVLEANTVLCYAEHFMPTALGQFGKARDSALTDAVLNKINKATVPISTDEIFKEVQQDCESLDSLNRVLHKLYSANKIQMIKKPGAALNSVAFTPVRALVKDKKFCDFGVLSDEERAYIRRSNDGKH